MLNKYIKIFRTFQKHFYLTCYILDYNMFILQNLCIRALFVVPASSVKY